MALWSAALWIFWSAAARRRTPYIEKIAALQNGSRLAIGSGLECQHGHLGTHAVTQPKTEADALVDVKIRVLIAIHSRGESTRLASKSHPAQTRQVNLAAVRMAAKHQVTATAFYSAYPNASVKDVWKALKIKDTLNDLLDEAS